MTGPEARLYRKSANTAAVSCYQGHTVVGNRSGLVVRAEVSHATGTAERDTALALLKSLPGRRRKTVAADKGYDVRSFVEGCRRLRITPHVAAKDKGSAMDQRTLRHVGYAISQIKRKRAEEPFGWMKLIAQLRQVKQRGKAQVGALFQNDGLESDPNAELAGGSDDVSGIEGRDMAKRDVPHRSKRTKTDRP